MIFLTAGHHNNDPGAIGNGFTEADLTREIRHLIHKRITQLSPTTNVWLDDDNDPLNQVTAKIGQQIRDQDLVIDLHFDAFTNPKASGTTALVSTNASERSKMIGAELAGMTSTILGIPNRGVRDEKQSSRGRLAILNMKGAAVLLEIAFISNPGDMANYIKNDEALKYWLAEEIAQILIKFDKP